MTTPEARPDELAALLEALTWSRVFPNDKASTRDVTVFQMTVGYIKRLSRSLVTVAPPDRLDVR